MREDHIMDPEEMHERSQQVFAEVLSKVTDDDLAAPTPCTEWDVAALIDHVVDGNRMTVEHMGAAPLAPRAAVGDRVRDHRDSAAGAHAVFSAPGWAERFVELPFGSIPAPVFASIRSGDLYAHAWDLATAIGVDADLDPGLGDAIHASTSKILSPDLRGAGRPFGEEQPCAPERPVADRFAAFLGRRP